MPGLRAEGSVHFRIVNRFENEAVLDHKADRLSARQNLPDLRRGSVERRFGKIKQSMGQSAFLMRGL